MLYTDWGINGQKYNHISVRFLRMNRLTGCFTKLAHSITDIGKIRSIIILEETLSQLLFFLSDRLFAVVH